MVERLLVKEMIHGSSPCRSATFFTERARHGRGHRLEIGWAVTGLQSSILWRSATLSPFSSTVEHLSYKQKAPGAAPGTGTI